MHLTVNMLIERQDGSVPPRIERILWIEQAGSRITTIDIQDKKAWPILHDRALLEEQFEAKALRFLEVDMYQHLRQPDDTFDPKHHQKRDQAYAVIQDIVEKHDGEIFFSHVLGPLVRKAVEAVQEKWRVSSEEERSKVTVYQYLRLYWQRGQMRNALLLAYDRCGAKGVARTIHGPKLGRPSKRTVETGVLTGVNITDEIKERFRQGTRLFYDTPKERDE